MYAGGYTLSEQHSDCNDQLSPSHAGSRGLNSLHPPDPHYAVGMAGKTASAQRRTISNMWQTDKCRPINELYRQVPGPARSVRGGCIFTPRSLSVTSVGPASRSIHSLYWQCRCWAISNDTAATPHPGPCNTTPWRHVACRCEQTSRQWTNVLYRETLHASIQATINFLTLNHLVDVTPWQSIGSLSRPQVCQRCG